MATRKSVWNVLSLAFLALTNPSVQAETAAGVAATTQAAIDRGNAPKWWTPELPDAIQRDVDSKGKRLAGQMKLDDEAKTQKAAALITEHFGRVWAWNQQVADELKAAWAAWDAARDSSNDKQKNEFMALTIMSEQIDPIYAQFAPQIQGLLRALNEEIGEEKTTELVDIITRSPGAKRTYDAYLAMVPEMTDAQQTILWDRMVQAREDALAAWSDGQIVKIFKKYKVSTKSRSTISGTVMSSGTKRGQRLALSVDSGLHVRLLRLRFPQPNRGLLNSIDLDRRIVFGVVCS